MEAIALTQINDTSPFYFLGVLMTAGYLPALLTKGINDINPEITQRIIKLQDSESHYLNLSNCNMNDEELDIVLSYLTENGLSSQIHIFDLERNQLTKISPEIENFTNILVLDLSKNYLSQIPNEMLKLNNLSYLLLDNNNFRKIPPELCNLPNMRHLYLDNNKLTEIPREIEKIKLVTTDANRLTIIEKIAGFICDVFGQ